MSVLKWKANSSSNFALFFIVMIHNSSVNFKVIPFLLWTKGFCIPFQLHERLFLCSFLAQTIYTFLNKSPLKWKFLRLLSTRVKFCQIPYANFETTSPFLPKFCIPLQFHERLLLCTCLAQTIYTLIIRSPLKWKSLTFECSDQNFSNSLCKFWNDESILSKFCIPLQFH